MDRASGILMPIFSLPSPHGIGTLGKAAFDFIDFLAAAGQSWWQLLPVGPTGYGDSPYQSFSSYAGNPYFIDPDLLYADGLLTQEEIAAAECGSETRIDYGALFTRRNSLLRKAAARLLERDGAAVEVFAAGRKWLPDYALYTAVKAEQGMRAWTQWPEELRLREEGALEAARARLAEEIRITEAIQYLFFRQWEALRAHAKEKGVLLLGDLPIYAAPDSADVWAEQRFFLLSQDGSPSAVAGVPPDYFSADGQLWGNPLYDWEAMAADGYGWWIRRIDGVRALYDAVRIDHFRAFASYWAVPAGAETARGGAWRRGPGMALLGALQGWFRDMRFVAEDLGVLGDDVQELLQSTGWPGMKVLQFAFSDSENAYLPHNCTENSICYTGTHDNNTLRGWLDEATDAELDFARRYLGVENVSDLPRAILRAGCGSVSALFVAPLADWLGLDARARLNRPGVPEGNWCWRVAPGVLTDTLAQEIRGFTALYGRTPKTKSEEKNK